MIFAAVSLSSVFSGYFLAVQPQSVFMFLEILRFPVHMIYISLKWYACIPFFYLVSLWLINCLKWVSWVEGSWVPWRNVVLLVGFWLKEGLTFCLDFTFTYDLAVLDCRFGETELCYRAEKSQARLSHRWLMLNLNSVCHHVSEKIRW